LVNFWQVSFIVIVILGGRGLFGGPLFASLGLFLLGLAWFSGRGKAEAAAGQGPVLPPPLQVESDKVPHLVGLQQADGRKDDDPEDKGVVGSGGKVNDLLGSRRLGKAVPKGQHGHGDGAEAGQNKEDLVHVVERPCHALFVAVGEDSASVENGFGDILENQQDEGDSGVVEQVGADDESKVKGGVFDASRHVFPLDFLEIQFRENVEPI